MPDTPRLAIVGASVRAAAQSAVRAGFEVVGADLFADADLDGVCPVTKIDDYPNGLADWLAAQDVDAWMYTGALENYPELVDRMAAIAPLWGVSGAALARCRDPIALQEVCRETGVAFPETLPTGDTPASPDGWLAKTYRHSNGVGVFRLDENEDENAYAQRYLTGASLAANYVISADKAALLGVTEQLSAKDAGGFGYRGSLGPVDLSKERRDTLLRVGRLLKETLGLRGIVGVDLVDQEGELALIEINPRWTASVEVLESASNPNEVTTNRSRSGVWAHAEACRGGAVSSWRWRAWNPSKGGQGCAGKRIVYAKEPATASGAFCDWAQGEQAAGRLCDLPRPGESFSVGSPVCTVMAKGLVARPVRSALRSRAQEVRDRLTR